MRSAGGGVSSKMLSAFNCRLLSTVTPGRQRLVSRPPPAVAALWSDDRLTSEVLKPSKSSSKRKAEHLRSLARELVKLGPRQLQAVSPVLETDAELLEAISTAKGITPTNQGRKRQEGLMACARSLTGHKLKTWFMFWSSEAHTDIVLKSSSNAVEDSNHVKLKACLLHYRAMQVDICSHLLQIKTASQISSAESIMLNCC
ncbi:hypothetical protein WJX77_003487 [Trebouxia sp. C0004]